MASVLDDEEKRQHMYDKSLGKKSAAQIDLDRQYEALDALCRSYNNRVELSSMRFYPKGGSLYRLFWTTKQYRKYGAIRDTMPACYETGDVDGLLLVVPRNLTNAELLNYVRARTVQDNSVADSTKGSEILTLRTRK